MNEMEVYFQDCDLLRNREQTDCFFCYRYDICKEYYEKQQKKWIPVTEQLPPAEKEVYVTDGEYIARANLLDEVFPGDKPCWSYSGLGEITHWCERIPLPQPQKEECE